MKKRMIFGLILMILAGVVLLRGGSLPEDKTEQPRLSEEEEYRQIMENASIEEGLQACLDCYVSRTEIVTASFFMESGERDFSWAGSAGSMEQEKRYPIASITKMYTGAVILKLYEQGRLDLEDTLGAYVSELYLNLLPGFEGWDYSREITIRQLLGHNTGLPNFYVDIGEKDRAYTFEEVLRDIQEEMLFRPGTEHIAYYSDVNYMLLGEVIESVTGKSLAEAYEEYIIRPLGLKNTYLQENGMNTKDVQPFFWDGEAMERPEFLASERSEGGIISNNEDEMTFLRAFFEGRLFPKEYLEFMTDWKDLGDDTYYGISICRYDWGDVTLVGHGGFVGSIALYCPQYDMYVVGTINLTGTAYAQDISKALMEYAWRRKEEKAEPGTASVRAPKVFV